MNYYLSISSPSHFSCMYMYICLCVSVLCVYVLYSRIQRDNILKHNNFYSLKQANVILYLTTVIVFPFHFIHNLHPVCVSVKLLKVDLLNEKFKNRLQIKFTQIMFHITKFMLQSSYFRHFSLIKDRMLISFSNL